MKFYMTPGSCSTGVHILLEEAGLVFEAYVLNLPKGDHLKPEYLAINPHGTIPTLVRDDGVALTDFVSIAKWIAEAYPRRKLLPEEPVARDTALGAMAFCVGHIHGEGFRRVFVPERYQRGRPPTSKRSRRRSCARSYASRLVSSTRTPIRAALSCPISTSSSRYALAFFASRNSRRRSPISTAGSTSPRAGNFRGSNDPGSPAPSKPAGHVARRVAAVRSVARVAAQAAQSGEDSWRGIVR